MIDMRIGEYHITSEPRNYIVSLAKLSDDGTPKTAMTKAGEVLSERALGYYNSLPQALQAIARDMLQNGKDVITTIDAYADKAETIEATLAAAVQEYGQKIQEADE